MQVARVISAAFALSFAMTVGAESRPLDSYESIVQRNPFGLKDPPPPVVKDTNPPPAQVKKEDFYLTGISTIGNPKRPKAYLIAKDAGKKDYDQKFYNLGIGDRQGDVTLQEIDPKGRRVKIAYLGEEKWLSMKENGVPTPAGGGMGVPGIPGAPGMAPGAPGMVQPGGVPSPVPLPLPTPGNATGAQPATYPNAGNTRRTLRTAGSNSTAGSYTGGAAPVPYGGAPAYANPGAVNTSDMVNGTPAAPPVPVGPQTDAEVAEQIIRMQAENAYRQKQGIPAPPIPKFQ